MSFLESRDMVVSTLSPVHIGCGEDFVPTEYVVDAKGSLHRFDPGALAALEDTVIMKDISTALANHDAEKQLHAVHAALQRHRERILPFASVRIPMCVGVHSHYKLTQDVRNDFNRNGIERTAFSALDQSPYLPGSSLKGAIRTALLNTRGAGRCPVPNGLLQDIRQFNAMIEDYDPGNGRIALRLKAQHSKRDYDSARKKIEKSVASLAATLGDAWLGGSFEADPLRALKVGDCATLDPGIEREIRFCLNRSRSGRRSQAQSKNLYTRLEYVVEQQPAVFRLSVALQNLETIAGRRDHRGHLTAPLAENLVAWQGLVEACNAYYLHRLEDDIRMIAKLCPTSVWVAQMKKLLGAGLRDEIEAGIAMLLRIGKHGGADGNTVDGRQIKIMLSEDKRRGQDGREERIRLYAFDSEPRTTWYCGDDLDKPTDLLPHGWIVLSDHGRPWQQGMRGHETRQRREHGAAELRRRQAEAAAAEQAAAFAETRRQAALAAMTPNQRRTEEFRAFCETRASQLGKSQEALNGPIHNRARQLAADALHGADWTPQEKAAVADLLTEWLPKLVSRMDKAQIRKLKVAALRGS